MNKKRRITYICPWPGPRPYDESESSYFLGREGEIDDILLRINSQRLIILSSETGAGKTSLINAGLIPKLRLNREKQSQAVVGMVLNLKNWPYSNSVQSDQILLESIQREITRLKQLKKVSGYKQLQKDIKGLSTVQYPRNYSFDNLCQYISGLCDSAGSIILILDQAEELLGASDYKKRDLVEREMLDIIGKLFNRVKALSLIISLREEFVPRLRRLDTWIPGLARRIYHLYPMKPETIEKVIEASSRISNEIEDIGKQQVNTIINYARTDVVSSNSEDNSDTVNLLNLQALLREIFQFSLRSGGLKKKVVIDETMLNLFKENIKDKPKDPLQRYIQRILNHDWKELTSKGQENIGEDEIALMRSIVTRIANPLSTPGGYKRKVEMVELLSVAVKDDLLTLCHIEKLRNIPERQFNDALLLWERDSKPLHSLLFSETDQQGIDKRSGRARIQGLTNKQTADLLIKTALKTFSFLSRQEINILKQTGTSRNSFELVHDGFGPAIRKWAEDFLKTPEQDTSALTAVCGKNFLWKELLPESKQIGNSSSKLQYRGLNWLGCNLQDIALRGIRFHGCDFKGSIFLLGDIEDCIFDNCNLNGTLFVGSKWSNVKILNCNMDAVLITKEACWGNNIQIENTRIDQALVNGLLIKGKVVLKQCQIRQSTLINITMHNNRSKFLFEECDLYGTTCPEYLLQQFSFKKCQHQPTMNEPAPMYSLGGVGVPKEYEQPGSK